MRLEQRLIDTYTAPDSRSGMLLICVPKYQLPVFDEQITNLDRPDNTIPAAVQSGDIETPQATISVEICEVETRNDGSILSLR